MVWLVADMNVFLLYICFINTSAICDEMIDASGNADSLPESGGQGRGRIF